jgi:TolA-binding protein
MNQPSIEEQLKAIEAALNLSQARNLPAVVPAASLPEDPRVRQREESRDLALAILQKMEGKIADLEAEKNLQRQQQMISEALHQEEREAIEVISGEVAGLKKRAARLEQWLHRMHDQPPAPPEDYPSPPQPITRQADTIFLIALLAAAAVGLLLFTLLRGP